MPDVPIEALQEAIRNTHGCVAAGIEAVPVKEIFRGQTVWELEEQDVRNRLGTILADQKRIGVIISANSNLNDRQVASLFRTQQTKDVAWAVDKGIIHEVRDFQIPPGSPVVSLVFQR